MKQLPNLNLLKDKDKKKNFFIKILLNQFNSYLNSKFKISTVKNMNVSVLIISAVLFLIYLGIKLAAPQFLVGGNTIAKQENYKLKTTDSAVVNDASYKYVFNNGNDCFNSFPLGAPKVKFINSENNPTALFCYKKYATQYNSQTKTPIWSANVLKKSDFNGATYHERTNDFREDPHLKGNKASQKPSDYTRSGWDRGHLAPSGDFAYNQEIMSESYYMTNIAPQLPENNRQIWRDLESATRQLIKKKGIDELYVTTGILYYIPKDKRGDKEKYDGSIAEFHGIKVPSHFYKVIVDPKNGMSAAFLIPNTSEVIGKSYKNYLIKISDLEELVKINFHHNLDDETAELLENVNSGTLVKHMK